VGDAGPNPARSAWSFPLVAPVVAHVRATDGRDGDLAVGGEPSALAAQQRAVLDRPWVWLHQVHGAEVVVLGPRDAVDGLAGAAADGVVTSRRDVALAVHTADCAGVALIGDGGTVGAVHAGWKGLVAGVLPAAVAAVRALEGGDVRAVLGPCIGPECYEFGGADLDAVAEVLGEEVRATTSWGTPALDLRAGVRAALRAEGVEVVATDTRCTACAGGADAPALYSHRARRDAGRQALLVWLAQDDGSS
jgi:hypothetical protein